MTFLDAFALIEFLIGGPRTIGVLAVLRGGSAALATANLAEILDVSQRKYGMAPHESMAFIDPLLGGVLTAVPLDVRIAACAGEIRAQHYNRAQRAPSLADCVLLASAGTGDTIATADPAVLAVAPLRGTQTVDLNIAL